MVESPVGLGATVTPFLRVGGMIIAIVTGSATSASLAATARARRLSRTVVLAIAIAPTSTDATGIARTAIAGTATGRGQRRLSLAPVMGALLLRPPRA